MRGPLFMKYELESTTSHSKQRIQTQEGALSNV